MLNFKKSLIALSLLASTVSVSTFAAETASLKVQGTITPGACDVTLDKGGIADFGTISAADLNQTEDTYLGYRAVNMSIECSSDMLVSFGANDEVGGIVVSDFSGSSIPSEKFSPGTLNMSLQSVYGMGPGIGAYALTFDHNTVAKNAAGENVTGMIRSTDNNLSWNGNFTSAGYLTPSSWATFGAGDTPVAFKSATIPMNISATIIAANKLNLTDELQLNGQSTINLVYL